MGASGIRNKMDYVGERDGGREYGERQLELADI